MLFFSLSRAAFFALLLSSVFALHLPNLSSRQEPGSPNWQCHLDCGLVTRYWHQGGDYCDTADFKTHLSNCLKCALAQEIWQWYGEDVKNAANKCHFDATPSPSSSQAPSLATATDNGGSTSVLSTDTGAISSSQTIVSATTASTAGERVSESTSETSMTGTVKSVTTAATAHESSSAKTTAEHISTIHTASGSPKYSESVTPSVTLSATPHVSSSAKGTYPPTSTAVPPALNAASPIQKSAVPAAFIGVLAWVLAA